MAASGVDGTRGFIATAQAGAARLAGNPLAWAVFVVVMMAWPVIRAVTTEPPPPRPVYGTIPDFLLVDQTGRDVRSSDLVGRVWVANFFFTRCPTVCPRFSAEMAKVRHRGRHLGDAFRVVSFSVDPAFDTPPVLAAYAAKYRAESGGSWLFLTGAPDVLKRTVVDGFKVSMGREGTGPAAPAEFGSIFHGTHFVLVDHALRIRGYYDMADADGMDRLLDDVTLIVNRGE